ncbi:MAG: nitrogen fixation protein NifZ, partial [Polyangiales bacterium]
MWSLEVKRNMTAESFVLGDMVWSRIDLINDGTIPDLAAEASLAPAGTRGVVVNVGHLEAQPDT